MPRLQQALENLRKQHQWGDISDQVYRQERATLERQVKLVAPRPQPRTLPNLDRAAELLGSMPALWSHPGVTDEQRERAMQEVFSHIDIVGKQITSIEPKSAYTPLFATMAIHPKSGYCKTEPRPPPPQATHRTSNCLFVQPRRNSTVGWLQRAASLGYSAFCIEYAKLGKGCRRGQPG